MSKQIMRLILICVVLAALLLASCRPAAEEGEGTTITGKVVEKEAVGEEKEGEVVTEVEEGPQYGGWLTDVAFLDVAGWDPPENTIAGSITALRYTNESLGMADWATGPAGSNEYDFMHYLYLPASSRTGALAISWEQTDPYTVVFHLREGVRWHDKPPVNGREFVADDVVFSYNRYMDSLRAGKQTTRWLESVSASDKYTVVFKLKELNYELLRSIGWGTTLIHGPREMVEKFGNLEDWRNNCGTGPFMIVDHVRGSSVTYRKNPSYWGNDEISPRNSIPYVDGVKYLLINDMSTVLAGLRTGKIDKISDISWSDAEILKQTAPRLKWKRGLAGNVRPLVGFRVDITPFDDVTVRRALCMAIDRESVLDNYLRGNGELFCWPFQVNWPDVYTSLDEVPDSVRETFQYDPEKARELLAEAGYPNGFKTNIVTQSALVDRVEILVSYWKAIGVDVEIQPYEYASYWAVVLGKKHEGLSACTAGVADPYAVLALFRTDSFYNTIQLNDPAFDEALAETLQSPDVEQRNLSYKEMAMSFMDQAYLFAFPTEYVYSFWQPWVNNYHGEVALPMYNNGAVAARVWVDMDLKQSMIGGR